MKPLVDKRQGAEVRRVTGFRLHVTGRKFLWLARLRNFKFLTRLMVLSVLLVTCGAGPAFASEGNVDSTHKYAWSENSGWQNYRPTHAGGYVNKNYLEGYIWCENVGWVRLGTGASGVSGTPPQYANTTNANWGVNNDGSGNLSGYAWGENAGWVNFHPTHSQVTVNTSTGEFDGYAWSENLGWIHFNNAAPAYKVKTNWPTITWDGSISTDWAAGANWDSGAAPSNADNVIIPDAGTTPNDPTVSNGAVCNNLVIAANGVLNGGANTLTVSGSWDNSGTFNCGTGKVLFNGAAGTLNITPNSNPFFDITFNDSAGAATFQLAQALEVDRNFALEDGIFDQNGKTLTVGGNWAFSGGSFTSAPSVTFDTAAVETTISGATTFNNVICATAGKTIKFTAATTQTVNGTLTLTGTSAVGGKITLRSTTDTLKWGITFPNGPQSATYVDVKDSDANTNKVTCYNSTDSLNNNANWVFSALTITAPAAGSNINQQPTIIGAASPGDNVIIKGAVGAVAFQQVAAVVADANGNYRVRQADYTATLDLGANNIRADVGAVQGAAVAVTVSAAPTTNQTPILTSLIDGGTVNGSAPTISGKGLAGQNVTLSANDANGNLLLTQVVPASAGVTVDANGNWTITSGNYTTSLVKGINYLSVTVGGAASNITTVTFTDPFGVVFDSVTNNPIANATVTIFNQNGTRCAPGVEIAPGDANPQTTGADGAYNFLTINGNFYITANAAGYNFPSTVTNLPAGRVIVNGSKGEVFTVAGAIIQMDFPMDSNDMLLKIKKTANKKEALIGDIVTYTVTIQNISATPVTGVYLADQIPAGFKYIKEKAILDNVPLEPSGNRPIVFNIGTMAAGATCTLKYQLVVGSGVTQGKYENTAWAQYSNGRIISNKDRQTVKVVLDPLFDLGTIIGKVFWDKNENARQDAPKKTDEELELETGIPDVKIVMEDGTVVTTDKDGKYHIQAVTPGRRLLRIDERTLPDGACLTTDKVVVIDTTPGLLSKVNFGVNLKDKGLKEIEKSKSPVKILQKEEKVKPFLNVSFYPSGVISYQGRDFEVKPLADDYEFKIFTNYSLFIKTWKIEILDRDTKALVRGFSGTGISLSEPVYWDGKDKNGKWLNPERNYVYILSVMDKTCHTDTTKEKDLRVVSYKPEILEVSKAECQRLKSEWIKKESRANSLDIQSIKLSDKVVIIKTNGGFESKQSVPKTAPPLSKSEEAALEPVVKDTSQINITIDEAVVPVLAPSEEGEEFVQEVVVPEGEHKVAVESIDKEGKEDTQTQYIKDKDNCLLLVAMGDAKAGYTFQKGSIEPAAPEDKYRKGFWSERKLAYYLKGKILGKYLITSSLDTERDQKALFRNLDPNKYYPVYGDASKVNYAATNTQGILYLLVEWDKSSALWGNYNVNFNDTEFAAFSRSLYGANVNYQTVSSTQFGEPSAKLAVFKATAKQQAAHNEFVGTGGSLFYLKNRDVIEGSEKVSIEVRDKVTGLVLAALKQEEGFDYEIDYDNGRLMFWEPVSHIAESSSIVSSALLNGNPVYVAVDYEYKTLEKYDEGVTGARVEQSITDYARLGGTYIREDQSDKNYGLAGLDTTLHLGKNTTITGEFAQSKSQELGRFISTDGGLTFTQLITDQFASGKAYGVKGESHLFDKLGVSGYYKKIEKDFSSISTASQQGKELIGAAFTYDITPKTRITTKHDIQELLADGNPQTKLQVGAKKTETTSAQITHAFDDKLKVTGEYRHQNVEDKIEKYKSETNENGDIAAGRVDYKAAENVNLFLEQQGNLKGSPNNQTTAGIDTKLNEYLSLRGKETVGTRGNAASVGAYTNITDRFRLSGDYALANYKTGDTDKTASVTAKAKVDENSEVYNTYSQTSSAREGRSDSSIFGAKKTLNNGLELSMEQQQANSKREISDTNILGVSGNVNDKLALTANFEKGIVQDFDGTRYNRNAPSLVLSYVDKDKIKASLKTEARFDAGTEDKRQYLIYGALEDKVTQDLTLFTKANVSNSKNTTKESTLAFYKEFTLGAAYRPVNFDRLNLLARYNYLSNASPAQQADIKDVEGYKAHIVSGEAAYDITDHWQVIEKLAIRMAGEKVTGFEFTKTRTWLLVNRLNYNVNRDWQVGAEYRRLAQSQAKDAKQGALVEIARNIGEYVQAGTGYNFTDFSDDLTSLDYTSQGPFVRLTGKFFDRTPEEIEQLRQKKEEENIKHWVQELVNSGLSGLDNKTAQELRHYYCMAEIARQEGRFETAKKYYAKVIEIGDKIKREAEDYVRNCVELEKTLARDDELAKTYYREGRLQEAKQLWEKIIKEGSVDIYPAKL
ncbi:MAG: hypothetical protein V1933_01110 [Candidatus Omnitrophota bacterium]